MKASYTVPRISLRVKPDFHEARLLLEKISPKK